MIKRFSPRRILHAALLVSVGQVTSACAQTSGLSITDTGQGQVGFSSSAIGSLSGITYLGGDSYLVVSDNSGTMAPATITIDRTTGQITASSIGTPVSVVGGSDLEGIAYDPRDGSVLISDEAGNTITRHLTGDGSQVGTVTVPSIYANAVGNRGLESLSLDPLGFNLWTANEEALSVDGALSTDSAGTIVRLQQFDSAGQPIAQYGYLTQPHSGDGIIVNVPGRSGVSDLLALPNEHLIVMERELGGLPTYRNRFYWVDTTTGSDTSDAPGLTAADDLVGKHLLYQVDALTTNFEGVALGPMLRNGDYVLVLVSDDGAPNNPQQLLALRLSGIAIDGDLNGDFVVDKDDLAVVLNAWGSAVTAGDRLAGDLDGDGQVGVDDLDAVLSNWSGTGTPPATVPEPGGLGSIVIGSLLMLGGRW